MDQANMLFLRKGPSPRTRGKRPACVGGGTPPPRSGPSPRTRGKLIQRGHVGRLCGSIPAHAGETMEVTAIRYDTLVHPRARGGNTIGWSGVGATRGPSPRTRGKRFMFKLAPSFIGSIPAHAGETHRPKKCLPLQWVHPRARGGNPRKIRSGFTTKGPSPRTRGKLVKSPGYPESKGSIPAHAGETTTGTWSSGT